MPNRRASWIGALIAALVWALPVHDASAACPDLSTSITHDLVVSSCELCGTGDVTIRVTHPNSEADLNGLRIIENLGSSGLIYVPGSTVFAVRYGVAPVAVEPVVVGAEMTWDLGDYVLPATPIPGLPQYLEISFRVWIPDGANQESLAFADRHVSAVVHFTTINEVIDFLRCSDSRSSGFQELPISQPLPFVTKAGRNVDAGQSGYSDPVFGHNNDDIIWRIRVENQGSADLQGLRISDVMDPGNFSVTFRCPNEGEAYAIANNNGVLPGGSACYAVTDNSLIDFEVRNPYGNPPDDSPDLVDVPAEGLADIFLVGKITSTGSCTGPRNNRVFDVQWGCENDPYGAGISTPASSNGITPSVRTADTAQLSTVVLPNGLNVAVSITGTNTSQRIGSKGRVRITITNNTGGTIKNIRLRDVLPEAYVVDPTYEPTVTMLPAYGAYPGMIDRVTWTNPVPGTFPNLISTDPDDPLGNTAPEFRLWSSTEHSLYPEPDQVNMMRHGDVLRVIFRVVLIRPQSYDKVVNLDVRTEAPNSDPAGTDPAHVTSISNDLFIDFEDFCVGEQTYPQYPIRTNHVANPEDLDIDIDGHELVFILTGDPAQRLPLTVNLKNNGGHDAVDYVSYVTFGATMHVVSAPAGCAPTNNPPPLDVWREPITIPPDATVFACTGPAIGPGVTVPLTFEVVKSTNPAALMADDLTFRADVVGEIRLSDGTLLWFPTPVNPRADGGIDRANNYSLDGIRARVIGFNLLKSQVGPCSENPPSSWPDLEVQIGEECTYHIDTGGWFGFRTPGFEFIAVQNIQVVDHLPEGQGYLRHDPDYTGTTEAIQGIGFNPSGLQPLDEVGAPEWLNWAFNWAPWNRITEKDHWFQVDMTSRIMNNPIDLSAVPNRHAAPSLNVLRSTFQAVYFNDTTGEEEIYDLGPDTVGYPRAEVRQIELTVTEPHITVIKEVCNESLYGIGPACTNFVPLADDGDAYNSYIYRLTVANESTRDGVRRAPAYDVIVTDRLDASDLVYVFPFESDGLDNDGDGLIGGVDTDGEGTISDNIVKNGVPAVIIFSHTHSSALRRIDAGDSVRLYYRVEFDKDAAPLQTFTNTADAVYDSLEGEFGSQSAPRRPNSDRGGARVYTSPMAAADVRIIPVETHPKRIVALSNTPLVGNSATQPVSIGEEIAYRFNTLLPVALLRDFVIRDELPAGLRCSEAPSVNLSAPPYSAANFVPGGTFAPTCSGGVVEWDFGDQRVTTGTAGIGNRYDFEIGFIARVENTAGTNDGDTLSNGHPATLATARYIDEAGSQVVLNFAQVDVLVGEPRIEPTKAFAVAAADAGDVLTVTVTAVNSGTATAYNLRVLDDLTDRNLTFLGNVGGINPPDTVDIAAMGANQPIFSWLAPNGIAPGATVSFTFEVRVDNVVQPLEVLANTIQADWTALPGKTTALNSTGMIGPDGSETGMRIGALPHAGHPVNDYEAQAHHNLTVPPVTLVKTDLDPAMIPAIGVHKSFHVDIRLPEGTTNDLIVTDSLDAAGVGYWLTNNADYDITYTFAGIATINGQVPSESAFNAFPANDTSGSAVWDIGTVITETENDPNQSAIDPLIRIHYHARINNDLVTNNYDTMGNSVVVTYTHGQTGDPEILTDDTAPVTVVEPRLAAAKTLSNVTPGKQPADPPEGGDLLEYVVAMLNSGTSTAYDVNVVDTLPATLSLHSGFTPTARIDGADVAGFVAIPANAPDGPLVWGRENGDNSLAIPAGHSLVLTYRTVVTAAGGDLSNSVMVDWTSLDGDNSAERTGHGCPNWTAPNDYCAGPAVATTTTVDNNRIDKTVAADTFDTAPWSTAGDAIARVGDIVTYRLAINLSGGLTRNLVVQDLLPAGMDFVETVQINGDPTAAYTSPVNGAGSNFSYAPITRAQVPTPGQTGALTWTLGDVVNDPFGDPTTDSLEIIYLARILPDAGIAHVATTSLVNTVQMDYATATGPATTRTDSALVTAVQPYLTVSKTAVAAGGDSVLAADELVTYTVDIINTGGAPAYDALLTDTLPIGMRNGTAGLVIVSMELLSGAVLPNLAPTYDAATGVATWDLNSGVADQYSIPAGDTLRIVYRVQAEIALGAGLTLTNQAQVQRYASLDSLDLPTQGSAIGTAQIYGPTHIATVTFTTDAPDALIKQNPAEPTASVGELFSYRITVPATPQATALHDVRILDDLSASAADLRFVGVTKVSGTQPWRPVNTGTDTQLVIVDPSMGIDIPAGEQIVIDITVVLADTAINVSGLQFSNTADYTFNQVDNDPVTQTPGGADTTDNMTIVGVEALTLEKSGPATMQVGTPATFTLNVHNPSEATAWNPTISDRLPNDSTGGMCAAGPTNVTAQLFLEDGVTPAAPPLVAGTDFAVSFNSAPVCEWTFNLLSPSGGIPSNQRLIVHYAVELDLSTANDIELTNVAGVTRWLSADPDVAGAGPRTYIRELSDGTPGMLDHQDAHTVSTESPVLEFQKSVRNITTDQYPGSNATPGDTLRYIIRLRNSGPVGLPSFSIVDVVDRLNAVAAFAPDSLNLISVPAGADTSGTSATGGAHGTGRVDVANLSIGAQGEPDDTLEVVFEIRLAPVITSGTVVLNQAELVSANPNPVLSDDPHVPGDEKPTETLIASAPVFEVLKTATLMEGDPDILMAGETLRYTLTIKNIGTEDAVNVLLRDETPANTVYVAGSTTLNGTAVPDPGADVNPLHAGIRVNAPDNPTPGYLHADATTGSTHVATVTFMVVVDPSAMDGLIICNQGFVNGSGAGSGPRPEQPSDDPDTAIADDPTCIIVGNLPHLYAHKTVVIHEDFGSPGVVDPGDVLRYTIVISNNGSIPATDVVLTDAVPTHSTYIGSSLRLNGAPAAPDGGVSPLIEGLPVYSADNPGAGIISAHQSAVITFEVRVNDDVSTGTLISNQGTVASSELPPDLTDADGVPANGRQPTVIVVGDVQLLSITKEVLVPGGAAAAAGGLLEYVIRVTNIGSVPALGVVLTDDLAPPLGNQVVYVDGSGTLNGLTAGVGYAGSLLTADYAAQHGDLQPGAAALVRFRVQIDGAIDIGTTITNTAVVRWNDPLRTASAEVSIDVGGTPGSAGLNGHVWHDDNLDKNCDTHETHLEGWSVQLYRNDLLITTAWSAADGSWRLSGLVPTGNTAEHYELRFRAPGAGPETAALGHGDSPFTNGPQRISAITVESGGNLLNMNLPVWPNGIVYNSVIREAVPGARLTMLNAATGAALPVQCFDDPVQQNQVTARNGFYKFDLNFSDAACPAGADYLIEVTPPAGGFIAGPSRIIPPASDISTAPFSILDCPGSADDAVPATVDYCEISASAAVPPLSVAPRTAGTKYHLHFTLNNGHLPGHSQVFNNPIPIDPELAGVVAITKTSSLVNVTRGGLVPYTITVTNVFGAPLHDIRIIDRFPAGFKYVAGSARLEGNPAEPRISGREMVWDGLELQVNQRFTIQFLLVVGSGVSEGEYVNRAQVVNTAIDSTVSEEATATVRVVPDPDFDCTDVIGKVFDDRNLDGRQDPGENGLAGVRVVTARGLVATTDEHGRFHITCAAVPEEDRGSNFILKLDERSLPTGYRLTTENPRVQRATRGKMLRYNFGATIHRVVRIDIADAL
jgi:large repetitive protein